MAAPARHESDIQLRADFLGEKKASVWMGASQGATTLSDNQPDRADGKPAKRGYWLERDLQRAIGVAKRARLECYRVELAPDGTISIVVGYSESSRHRKLRRS